MRWTPDPLTAVYTVRTLSGYGRIVKVVASIPLFSTGLSSLHHKYYSLCHLT